MDFSLTDEQRLLRETVDRFVAEKCSFEQQREMASTPQGFSRDIWGQFAELGWLAVALPEEFEGFGGSQLDIAVLMEGFGHGLVLTPYLSTVVLGGGLLTAGGSQAQKAEWLPAIAEGRMLVAVAHTEPRSRYDLCHVESTARKDGSGYVLDGHKSVVFHGGTADKLLVSARTAGNVGDRDGITVFAIDPGRAVLRPYPTIDGGRAAELTLEGVSVESGDVVGEVDGGLELIEYVVDRGITAVCAEAVGIMGSLVWATSEYLKTREQFGRPLSKFQSLQHRSVDMLMEYELSKSLARRAAVAVEDSEPVARAQAASAAKIQIGKAGKFVGQQAVQLHGGMGMADELPIGHYFKRLSMINSLFGDVDYHLQRFADLDGSVLR